MWVHCIMHLCVYNNIQLFRERERDDDGRKNSTDNNPFNWMLPPLIFSYGGYDAQLLDGVVAAAVANTSTGCPQDVLHLLLAITRKLCGNRNVFKNYLYLSKN